MTFMTNDLHDTLQILYFQENALLVVGSSLVTLVS